MTMIKGITVTLYEEVQTGTDGFGAPVYKETPVEVENVLVAPASSEDQVTELDLYGKRSVYTLAIPKGDTHNWENKKVEFFGKIFRTFDDPIEGMEHRIPLDWNRKVKVERNE